MSRSHAQKSITKKGLSHEAVAAFILVAFLIILLIIFITKSSNTAGYLAKKEECKKSFLMHATTAAVGIPIDLKCQTNYFILNYDPGTETGKEMIKRELADLWLDACDVFENGKYELFKQEGTYCAVYAVVNFEKEGKVPGMYEYLLKTNAPGTNEKYVERCAVYKTDTDNLLKEFEARKKTLPPDKQVADEIDTSKDYAIIFVYTKEKDWFSNMKDYFGGGWSSTAKLGAGGAVLTYATAALIIGSGGTVALAIGAAGGLFAAYEVATSGEKPQWISSFLIKEYDKKTLEDLGCKEFPVVQQYRPKD